MTDPTGRYTLVFNGEIFNFSALRPELEALGHRFRTRGDTEVLLAACIEWGEAAARRLNGQFAFALWDARQRTLFAARDRFGEKPFYWARADDGRTVIASEIGAILASGLIAPKLSREAVDAYLGLFYVPPDRSIYQNVHPLPPAHAAVWRVGDDGLPADPRFFRYWSPSFGAADAGPEEAARHVLTLLGRAVERQCVADVPLGAFLSGGLDSSTIVALMSRRSSQAVKTFAVGFGGLVDELPFAADVAAACGADHLALQADLDVAASLDRMSVVYDEPFGDSSNIPTYFVAEHARRHVTVALSGDGGDELFGGYEWYRPLLDPGNPAGAGPGPCAGDRHLRTATAALEDRSALWGGNAPGAVGESLRRAFAPEAGVDGLDAAAHFDTCCYLPGDILTKVDRASMAHGLEVRAPFLDADLADFVFSLPASIRFTGGSLKPLLRNACQHLWPESIRGRKKQGFGAPVGDWLKQPAVARMWERVSAADGALGALLPGVHQGQPTRPQRRWVLLCLGLWLERRPECLKGVV